MRKISEIFINGICLEKILEDHKKWLMDSREGKKMELKNANLSNIDLGGVNLISADLSCANLIGANLNNADLSGANLIGADLRNADLSGADLRVIEAHNFTVDESILTGESVQVEKNEIVMKDKELGITESVYYPVLKNILNEKVINSIHLLVAYLINRCHCCPSNMFFAVFVASIPIIS